ncbi:uncharacterized protein IL334_001691 [Kwoniella shivajii]|uniref:Rab family protein n=1 Tax=Kwoniella shivajii TaxID=564305 RepID=A0ABZ1CTS4_9TREE|nr:hypothetical protein IL334_001691 [Kwoniella shivajii]
MSVVASPLHHQAFSDTELFVPSGSVSAHAELPPPLPSPLPGPEPLSVPFPIFQHRHTSPYPSPHSFSALGPPPSADMSAHVLGSIPAPLAPKGSPVSLPALTPEIAPQAPMPLTPDPSPPASKVLSPTMMIKLAPPASNNPYEISFLEHREDSLFPVQFSPESDPTPRRIPTISIDTSVSNVPTLETPPARIRSNSGLDVRIPQTAPVKISSESKPSRPKSMGPPPRPRRSQTAYPAPQSVRMMESRSADSRAKLRNHIPLPRQASHGLVNSPSIGRALSDAGQNTPPRTRPVALTGSEMAPPDLGGPDGLEAKVVLLGSQGVGKTSLILRYTTKQFSLTPAPATIGSSLHARKLVHDGVRVKLQIWDTAGQERFRSMAPIYYRGAHVCVLVYDISDRQSFEDVRSWLEELGRTVPKETVIFVVGAKIDLEKKRVVTFDEARLIIQEWLKPSPVHEPTILLSPPPRSIFRSATSASRTGSPATSKPHTTSNTGGPPSRSHSYNALSSLGCPNSGQSASTVPAPKQSETPRQPTPGVPFPMGKPSAMQSQNRSTPAKPKSSSPPSVRFLSPTSPSSISFPALQSPTRPTSATFTDPVGPSITQASAIMGHRSNRSSRFSLSGVLGLSRTTSISEAVTSLSQLAEVPTSPRQIADSPSMPKSQNLPETSSRVRIESTPLFPSYDHVRADRRKSEDWSSRSWKMGQGPGAAETLGEFGDGVKRKQSGDLLDASTPLSASITQSAFKKQPPSHGTRSRGGSLGRDPRLYGSANSSKLDLSRGGANGEDQENENDGSWGVQVENVRLGECSALSGQGVEALFKYITSLLVEKKDKIERERVLRKKNSVMLTDPTKDGKTDEAKSKAGYGCCA